MVSEELHRELAPLARSWPDNREGFVVPVGGIHLLHEALRKYATSEVVGDVAMLLDNIIDHADDSAGFAAAVVARAQSLRHADGYWRLVVGVPVCVLTRSQSTEFRVVPDVCPVADISDAMAKCLEIPVSCSVRAWPYAIAPQLLWDPVQEGPANGADYLAAIESIETSLSLLPGQAMPVDCTLDMQLSTASCRTTVGARLLPVEVSMPEGGGTVEALQRGSCATINAMNQAAHTLRERITQAFMSACGEAQSVVPLAYCGPIGDLIPLSVWNRNTMGLFILASTVARERTAIVRLDVDEEISPGNLSGSEFPIVAILQGEMGEDAIGGRGVMYVMCGLSPEHLIGCLLDHIEREEARASADSDFGTAFTGRLQ